jgi:hypothetical protein
MNNEIDQQRDDMQDRLIDLALQEKLGGKRPPDIASPIRSQPSVEKSIRRVISSYKSRSQRHSWFPYQL